LCKRGDRLLRYLVLRCL
nr:immunoglobulin heavy chain junction region [Mus musculus]